MKDLANGVGARFPGRVNDSAGVRSLGRLRGSGQVRQSLDGREAYCDKA